MIRERVISSCPVEHGQGDSGGACIASSSLGTLAIHPRLQFPDQIILFDVPGTVGLWPEFRHRELSFQADGHDGSHEWSRSGDNARWGRPLSRKRPSDDSMAYLAEPEEPPWCGLIEWMCPRSQPSVRVRNVSGDTLGGRVFIPRSELVPSAGPPRF